MEINITALLEQDMFAFSHSAAEGGQEAVRNTWQAALDGPRPLLTTPEQFDAFRDHVRGFGTWSAEEIAAWSENECQALFLQMIAGDTRECPAKIEDVDITVHALTGNILEFGWFYASSKSPDKYVGPYYSRSDAYRAAADEHHGYNQTPRAESLDEIDWSEYEAQANEGRIAGRLFRTDSGEVFYTLDN